MEKIIYNILMIKMNLDDLLDDLDELDDLLLYNR